MWKELKLQGGSARMQGRLACPTLLLCFPLHRPTFFPPFLLSSSLTVNLLILTKLFYQLGIWDFPPYFNGVFRGSLSNDTLFHAI
jgi:hypothetical protein